MISTETNEKNGSNKRCTAVHVVAMVVAAAIALSFVVVDDCSIHSYANAPETQHEVGAPTTMLSHIQRRGCHNN